MTPLLLALALSCGVIDIWYPGEDADDDTAPRAKDADDDGWTSDEDCDDSDPDVHPGADEHCDGVDEDCDGRRDEDAVDAVVRYPDADGDGYGDPDRGVRACEHSAAYLEDHTDCDDFDRDVHPGAVEVCDGKDDDCDGEVDEGVGGTWYADADEDGYGDPDAPVRACGWPDGTVKDSTDCDDSDPSVHPGAEEVCNDGIDNDCDGAPGPGCGLTGKIDLSEADAKLFGEEPHGYAGWSLASGDVNGDAVEDIIVGARGEHLGGRDTGEAYLVLGPVSGTVNLSMADAKLVGEAGGDSAGDSLASGDVNGDGVEDILVGARGEDAGGSEAGAAYLVLGPVSGTVDLSLADAKLVGEAAGDNAGFSLASGDVNGDGVEDVLVGAPYDDAGGYAAGAAYLVLGPATGTVDLSLADAKLIGEEAEDHTGWTWSLDAGDVDGDGLDDVLVGALHEDTGGSSAGAAYLVLGPVSGEVDLSMADAKLVGEGDGDYAGYALSSGDVNGDGVEDILVGAEWEDAGGHRAGAAYLVLGPVTGDVDLSTADAKLVGEDAGDEAGCSLASGDVNGDAVEDILVGATGEDPWGGRIGAAYLVLGPVSGTVNLSMADAKLVGEVGGDEAGGSLASGDVNGDGVEDVLVGARYNDTGGYMAGAAYLLYSGGL